MDNYFNDIDNEPINLSNSCLKVNKSQWSNDFNNADKLWWRSNKNVNAATLTLKLIWVKYGVLFGQFTPSYHRACITGNNEIKIHDCPNRTP